MHPCEEELVCKCNIDDKVPYFNATVYLENKQRIGQIDEVFGPVNELMFTVKTDKGVLASAFKENDKIYINPEKLLPKSRFTDPPKPMKRGRGGGSRGRGGRGMRRGGFRGRGRGGFGRGRGRSRGRFRGRGR